MSNADLINKLFTTIDADGDGEIQEAELLAKFKEFDTDANGKVNKTEFTTAFTTTYGISQERAVKLFHKLDRDGSGDVTIAEIQMFFKDMDADGDGAVSRSEFEAAWTALMK